MPGRGAGDGARRGFETAAAGDVRVLRKGRILPATGWGAQQIFQRDDGALGPVGFFGRFGGFPKQDAWDGHDTR